MTTTDMDYMSKFDEYLPTGEMLLEDLVLDTSLLANPVDQCSTTVNKLPSGVLMIEDLLNDKHGNFTDNTWLSECVDLSSTFEMLDGDSFHSSSSKHDLFPSSPDSGIGSPSSNNGDIVSPGSLSSECDSPINSPIQQDVLTVSEEDLEYLNGLWKAEDIFPLEIAATNDVTSPPDPITYTPHTTATVPALTENSLLGVTFTLVPCPEDLALPVLPKPSTTPPRKMKSLSTKEKKERKRAQNKSAATRYREKKRSEFQTVDAQMKTQEEKNRSLKDKVNQITREMQYLKDLLIEVYRTKGIIK